MVVVSISTASSWFFLVAYSKRCLLTKSLNGILSHFPYINFKEISYKIYLQCMILNAVDLNIVLITKVTGYLNIFRCNHP